MKLRWMTALAVVLAAQAAPALFGPSGPPAEMSVQVQSGQVRATPSFLGQVVATVKYGDRLDVVEQQNGWTKVRTPAGKEGWMHDSALTRKRVVMKAGAEDVQASASGEELALAGKGFNSDVEAEFKNQNKDIDFTWVDRMLKYKVTPEEMRAFLKEGEVTP